MRLSFPFRIDERWRRAVSAAREITIALIWFTVDVELKIRVLYTLYFV